MKYLVNYKEKKRNCCPPSYYWVVQENIIVANDIEDLKQKLAKGRYAVEIQQIKSIEL